MVHRQNESTISILESENVGASDARTVMEEMGREIEALKRDLEEAERTAREKGREVSGGGILIYTTDVQPPMCNHRCITTDVLPPM
jgi:hypothetical protein